MRVNKENGSIWEQIAGLVFLLGIMAALLIFAFPRKARAYEDCNRIEDDEARQECRQANALQMIAYRR